MKNEVLKQHQTHISSTQMQLQSNNNNSNQIPQSINQLNFIVNYLLVIQLKKEKKIKSIHSQPTQSPSRGGLNLNTQIERFKQELSSSRYKRSLDLDKQVSFLLKSILYVNQNIYVNTKQNCQQQREVGRNPTNSKKIPNLYAQNPPYQLSILCKFQNISCYRVQRGHPSVYLPIIHFYLLSYSKPVAQNIRDKGFEFHAQNDYEFVTTLFNVLNQLFTYKPPFNIDQFFQHGMPDRKLGFVLDIISLVKSKNAILNKRSSSQKPKSVTFKDEEGGQVERQSRSRGPHNGSQQQQIDMYATLNPAKGFNKNDLILAENQPNLTNQLSHGKERQSSRSRPSNIGNFSNQVQSQNPDCSDDQNQKKEQLMRSPKYQQDSRPTSSQYNSRSRQQQPINGNQAGNNSSQNQSHSIMMKHYSSKPPVTNNNKIPIQQTQNVSIQNPKTLSVV